MTSKVLFPCCKVYLPYKAKTILDFIKKKKIKNDYIITRSDSVRQSFALTKRKLNYLTKNLHINLRAHTCVASSSVHWELTYFEVLSSATRAQCKFLFFFLTHLYCKTRFFLLFFNWNKKKFYQLITKNWRNSGQKLRSYFYDFASRNNIISLKILIFRIIYFIILDM